jgi:hypothetical protein
MARFSVPKDVVFRDLVGESVILDLRSGVYFGLNEVGTRIWQILSQDGDKEAVLRGLLQEFDVEEPRLRQELDSFVKELCERGLLVSDA